MLVAGEGEPTVVHAVAHRQSYPGAGFVEQDPDELLRNVRACLEAAGEVDAVGLANQGESCLAWDRETGRAVSPVIVWQDARTHEAIEALAARGAGEVTRSRAGLPLDAYFSASKLAWILAENNDARALLGKGRLCLGTTDAFFIHNLTGAPKTDISTAARTSLMNLSGQWDEELCGLFGVPMECLSPILASAGNFGSMRAGKRDIPLKAAIVDQAAALYGHGARERGDAKITFGTGAFVLSVVGTGTCETLDTGLSLSPVWQKDGAITYGLEGGVYDASAAVNWARSLGLFTDYSEIAAFEGPMAVERDLVFVPALSGLAAPYWDRRAGGLWLGMSLDTTPRDLVRALLEGIAFQTAEVIDAMDRINPVGATISVDGGMSANPAFRQMLADILDRRIVVPDQQELTAIGVAALMGVVSATTAKVVHRPQRSDCGPMRRRYAEAVRRASWWRS